MIKAGRGKAMRGPAKLGWAGHGKARAMAVILSAAIALPSEAATCHHFRTWLYPWPQRCGMARQMVRQPVLHSVAASSVPNQEHPGNEARLVRLVHGPDPEIPLPSLARADCEGGEADEAIRAHALLRAALEAANAR
jgi:hypothetical protein